MLVWTTPVDTASRGMWKYGGKRNKHGKYWEPPMIYLAWKVLGTTRSFSLTGKACHPKCLSLSFLLWALAPLQISTSLCEGPFYWLYAIFIFIWVPIFSYKAPTKGHYDHTWGFGVANMRVCFMNGSMIEHNGLGITCFSVDILKDIDRKSTRLNSSHAT